MFYRTRFVSALALGLLLALAGCESVAREPADTTPPIGRVAGCYVDVYQNGGYGGQFTRFWGPTTHLDLQQNGKQWAGTISSLVVGPNAYVRVSDGKAANARVVWFGPNQQVANLDRLKLDNAIRIIEVVQRGPVPIVPETEQPAAAELFPIPF